MGTTSLEGFGCEDMGPALGAAGAVIQYLKETQKTSLKHIGKIQKYQADNRVLMDKATQQSLEITQTIRARDREGSLLSVIDQTKTPMGAPTAQGMDCQPFEGICRNQISSNRCEGII